MLQTFSNVLTRKYGIIVLSATLVCIASLTAQAEFILEFAQGENGYYGLFDSGGNTVSPDDDVSKSAALWWDDNDGPADAYIALFRFDELFGDGPNQIPKGRTIVNAILRLKVLADPGGGNSGQFARFSELLVPVEDGPYSSQPWGDSYPEEGVHYSSDHFVLVPGPGHNDVLKIVVTDSIQRWSNDETENYGWLVLPGGDNAVGVYASEIVPDRRPELVVQTPLGEFRFMDGVDGYEGTVDTSVAEEALERNEGRSPKVLADGGDADGTWPLVRFDGIFGTGANQIPLGTPIDSAVLRLSVFNSGNETTIHDLKPGHPFTDLSDDEAAAAGVEPTNFGTFGDIQVDNGADYFDLDAVLDTIPGGHAGMTELDVTSSIQRYSNGEENAGWIFQHLGAFGGVADGVEWRSREWVEEGVIPQQKPELIVTTSTGEYRFMDGVNGYEGCIDTSIAEEALERNEGRRDQLLTDGTALSADGTIGAPDGTWVLMKFEDIIGSGPGQIPVNETIEKAVIRLSVFNPGAKTSVHDLKPGHPFTEYSNGEADALGIEPTNYGTFGNIRDNLSDFFDLETELSDIPSGFSGNIDLDVTPSVQRYANGEENTGWILHHAGALAGSADGVEIHSSEWVEKAPPKLTVKTTDGQVYSFQEGKNGYKSTVDTYMNSGDGFDLVFGVEQSFWTDGSDRNGDNTALLRFDDIIGDDAEQIPPNATIESANVEIVIYDEGGPAFVYDLLPGAIFDDETTSFISFTEEVGDLLYGEGTVRGVDPIAESPGFGTEGIWSFDVTASIQRHANGEENAGWGIIPDMTSGNGTGYVSSDGFIPEGQSRGPRLFVKVEGEPNEGTGVFDFMIYE